MKRWGFLFQPGALWIGAHYSRENRRWCINIVPFLTVWICCQGGNVPRCAAQKPSPVGLYQRSRRP